MCTSALVILVEMYIIYFFLIHYDITLIVINIYNTFFTIQLPICVLNIII